MFKFTILLHESTMEICGPLSQEYGDGQPAEAVKSSTLTLCPHSRTCSGSSFGGDVGVTEYNSHEPIPIKNFRAP